MRRKFSSVEEVRVLKQDTIEVSRDCEASLIPSGVKVTLQKGSLVYITQALGNAYTVY